MELQLEQVDLHELSAATETNYEHTNAFLKITGKIRHLFELKLREIQQFFMKMPMQSMQASF